MDNWTDTSGYDEWGVDLYFETTSISSDLYLLELKTGRKRVIIRVIDFNDYGFSSPSITDDGRTALTGCSRHMIALWNLENLSVQLLYSLSNAFIISPKGDCALISDDKFIYIWNLSDPTYSPIGKNQPL